MVWKKTPNSAEFHIFEQIDAHNKKHHPIRFFFVETIPSFFRQTKHSISQARWWILHRIHPKHRYHVVKTELAPGYYDIPMLLLYANFSFIIRFVEKEKCFENINWNSSEVHACVANEIQDLYYWWTIGRPLAQKIIDDLYEQVDNSGVFTGTELSKNNKRIYETVSKIENNNMHTDKYQLKRLMSIKDFMWV